MELPFAGTHQLCARMLDRIDALPPPQRHALSVALGLASGNVPDRFLVGLAVLSLLSATAEERPLLCLEPGPRLRRATGVGGVGGDRGRRSRSERFRFPARLRRPPSAAARGPAPGRCAHPACERRPRSTRRPRPRTNHRRDPRQPACSAGAAAAHDRCGAGSRLRAPRRRGPSGAYRGPLRAGRGPAARSDAATDAAGGSRPRGRRDARLACGAEARYRTQRARARRGCGAARDRGARPVPPSAGALGGLSGGVGRQPAACARSAGGGERSGD